MRITAGSLGGRVLSVPKGIRPTQERVREAYFSKMGVLISGCSFLDLFAGSGAVGLESLSRGAVRAVMVEQSRSVVKILEGNIRTLGETGVSVVCADVSRYLAGGCRDKFNLIYADPPYEMLAKEGFAQEIMGLIYKEKWLEEDGVFTLERRAGGNSVSVDGWNLMDSRRYGGSHLDFYVLKGV